MSPPQKQAETCIDQFDYETNDRLRRLTSIKYTRAEALYGLKYSHEAKLLFHDVIRTATTISWSRRRMDSQIKILEIELELGNIQIKPRLMGILAEAEESKYKLGVANCNALLAQLSYILASSLSYKDNLTNLPIALDYIEQARVDYLMLGMNSRVEDMVAMELIIRDIMRGEHN